MDLDLNVLKLAQNVKCCTNFCSWQTIVHKNSNPRKEPLDPERQKLANQISVCKIVKMILQNVKGENLPTIAPKSAATDGKKSNWHQKGEKGWFYKKIDGKLQI